MVVLDELGRRCPSSAQASRLIGLDHEAALVAVDLGLDQDDPVELRRQHARGISPATLPVLLLVVLAVLAGADRAPPLLVVAIPGHGLLEALGEVDLRLPAELLAELLGGERVAAVVAGAVGDVLDQRLVARRSARSPASPPRCSRTRRGRRRCRPRRGGRSSAPCGCRGRSPRRRASCGPGVPSP